jgi:hypothetical protein
MVDRKELEAVVEKLKRNRFDAVLADTIETAREIVLGMVDRKATVGVANSVTVRQVGVVKALQERGNTVFDPVPTFYGLTELNESTIMETVFKASLGADVFLSGTNAVTRDGKLVNIDGLGNRVTGIIFGARTSIIIVGRNKVVEDVDAGIHLIKNIVTPTLARRRELSLPCAKVGKCVDCSVPERACNVTVVIEKRLAMTDMKIVVIDDDVGLAWDPQWPEERIQRIRERYEEFDWPYAESWNEYKASFRRRHSLEEKRR